MIRLFCYYQILKKFCNFVSNRSVQQTKSLQNLNYTDNKLYAINYYN